MGLGFRERGPGSKDAVAVRSFMVQGLGKLWQLGPDYLRRLHLCIQTFHIADMALLPQNCRVLPLIQ